MTRPSPTVTGTGRVGHVETAGGNDDCLSKEVLLSRINRVRRCLAPPVLESWAVVLQEPRRSERSASPITLCAFSFASGRTFPIFSATRDATSSPRPDPAVHGPDPTAMIGKTGKEVREGPNGSRVRTGRAGLRVSARAGFRAIRGPVPAPAAGIFQALQLAGIGRPGRKA